MGVGRRRRVMPLGAARQYTMEPHAYYDASAEITTEGTKIKFMRSKIRCTSFAEWMEISDPETGKAVWRVEARFADRNFYAPEITGEGKQERKYSFVTAIRLYRGYEKDPAVMLVHRDQQPGGMGEPHSNKSVEVYMCRAIGDKAAADLDPDAELDEFLRDGTSGRPLMPKLQEPPASWAPTPDTDESFFFMNAKQGEDQFLMISNATLTSISLSALTEFSGDSSVSIVERRVLANLKRNDVTSPRKLEIDSALDDGLVIALFAGVDQLLVSHDALEYDVEWPNDFSQTYDSCVARRNKDLRKAPGFLQEDQLPNSRFTASKPRGCFGLF